MNEPPILYTSDSHFGHKNIIKYSWRPFDSVADMNIALVTKLREAEATGSQIVHCGDISFDLARFIKQYGPIFYSPKGKRIVLGNHDRTDGGARKYYESQFEVISGHERDWRRNGLWIDDVLDGQRVRVLCSHEPQENLWGADFNVHGHIHNTLLLHRHHGVPLHHPEDSWVLESPVHLNACVELHGFAPVTLEQLVKAHQNQYADAVKDLRKPPETPEMPELQAA